MYFITVLIINMLKESETFWVQILSKNSSLFLGKVKWVVSGVVVLCLFLPVYVIPFSSFKVVMTSKKGYSRCLWSILETNHPKV